MAVHVVPLPEASSPAALCWPREQKEVEECECIALLSIHKRGVHFLPAAHATHALFTTCWLVPHKSVVHTEAPSLDVVPAAHVWHPSVPGVAGVVVFNDQFKHQFKHQNNNGLSEHDLPHAFFVGFGGTGNNRSEANAYNNKRLRTTVGSLKGTCATVHMYREMICSGHGRHQHQVQENKK